MQILLRHRPRPFPGSDTVGPFSHRMHQVTEPTKEDVVKSFKKPIELVNYDVWLVMNMQRSFKGKPVGNSIEVTSDQPDTPVDLPAPVTIPQVKVKVKKGASSGDYPM